MANISPILPSKAEVRFPLNQCRGDSSDYWVVTVPIEEILPAAIGSPGSKILHDSLVAISPFDPDADPDNVDEINSLANQLAIAYYEYSYASFDYVFNGVFDWESEGLSDCIEITFDANEITTRVYSGAINCYPEEFCHTDWAKCPPDTLITDIDCEDGIKKIYGVEVEYEDSLDKSGKILKTVGEEKYLRDGGCCDCSRHPKCTSVCFTATSACPGSPSVTLGLIVPTLFDGGGSSLGAGTFFSGPARWCWSNVGQGTGYTIQVVSGTGLPGGAVYHNKTVGPFTLDEDCAAQSTVLIPWTGWNPHGNLNDCSGSFDSRDVVTIVGTCGSQTQTTTSDGNVDATYPFSFPTLFSDFDPSTGVAHDLTITFTSSYSTFNPRTFTFSIDPTTFKPAIFSQGVCQGFSGFYNPLGSPDVFKYWDCATDTQNDVIGGYLQGGPCCEPIKKTLNLNDSVYGDVVINYVPGLCDGSGRPIYKGTKVVSSPGCTVNSSGSCCPGGPAVIDCPTKSITLNYTWGPVWSNVGVSWKYAVIGCDDPTEPGLPCPDDNGTHTFSAGGITGSPTPNNVFACGESLLVVVSIGHNASNPCPLVGGSPRPDMYGSTSPVFTISE